MGGGGEGYGKGRGEMGRGGMSWGEETCSAHACANTKLSLARDGRYGYQQLTLYMR